MSLISNQVLRLLSVLAIMVILSCSSGGDLAGTGSSTGNANVAGIILDSNDEPSINTRVYLIPKTYNPGAHDLFPDSLIDTTESDGKYAFNIAKSDTYNIQAVHSSNYFQAFKEGIIINQDSIKVPQLSLKEPGSIKIILPDTIEIKNRYIYIPGTLVYKEVAKRNYNISPNDKSVFMLDSVPSATFSTLYYTELDDPSDTIRLTDTFTVPSSDTITIGTSTLGTIYNTENSGLPDNRVLSVTIDSDGSKWFGTYNEFTGYGKIVHFDGKEWDIHDIGIRSAVLSLAVDAHGVLWCGTGNAILKYDGIWSIYDNFNTGIQLTRQSKVHIKQPS